MDVYKIEDEEYQDRLSELPKSLILRILSFLPMRDVVSTTLLSKSWENLWTTVPCLNFGEDTSAVENGIERFRNFVNRALILWEGTKILKFEICIQFDMSLSGDIDLWMRFAVKNKVEELNINLYCEEEDECKAPRCLNSCSSLRKLSLHYCSLQIHGSPAWKQLKCLKMDGFFISEQSVNQILLGSPQLEVFDLCRWESKNLNIESASLKKLTICKNLSLYDDNKDEQSVLKICCPNLETLEISGDLFGKCLLTNVASLTDANLGFYNPHDVQGQGNELLGETMRQILQSIPHIEKVTLSFWCVEVLGVSLKEYLFSPFPNVKFLKVDDADLGTDRLTVIINFLGFFPNLEMLVIREYITIIPNSNANNYLEFETSLSKSSVLGQLKTIDIDSYPFSSLIRDGKNIEQGENSYMFHFIEFVLKHALKLEKLVIWVDYGDLQQICSAKVLTNMPRSSPNAKVIFKSRGPLLCF